MGYILDTETVFIENRAGMILNQVVPSDVRPQIFNPETACRKSLSESPKLANYIYFEKNQGGLQSQ